MDVRWFRLATWEHVNGERLLVVVNYAANQGQCYARRKSVRPARPLELRVLHA